MGLRHRKIRTRHSSRHNKQTHAKNENVRNSIFHPITSVGKIHMAHVTTSLIVLFAFIFNSSAFANDLEEYAKEVPTQEIDKEIEFIVQKEIGADIAVSSSHYTLAKYIRMENKNT